MYGKQPLKLKKGMSTLKATTWDDLVAQLDEIKTITIAGGLDEALAAAANAIRLNFKVTKDKKVGKG
jgi:soluble cytochrome b562